MLCKKYASSQVNKKQNRQGKFHELSEAIYFWLKQCCAVNLYPISALIQEEALQIKERMVEAAPELDGFLSSNGWLESFKMSYGIRGTTTTIAGEAGTVPITTVKTWMERLPELMKGYLPEDIVNMDELGLFCTARHRKVLLKRERKVEVENKVKEDAPLRWLWLIMVLCLI